MSQPSRTTKEDAANMNVVLYSGYLDKHKSFFSKSFKKRYVVLTPKNLYWFKRPDTADLFGEQRGALSLSSVIKERTRILNEDSASFELHGTDGRRRVFTAPNSEVCAEWVSAIKSAVQGFHSKRDGSNGTEKASSLEKDVLVSIVSICRGETESIIARSPEWQRLISLSSFRRGDQLMISLTNGGTVRLDFNLIQRIADKGGQMDLPVQMVPIASSLSVEIIYQNPGDVLRDMNGYGGYGSESDQRTSIFSSFSRLYNHLVSNRGHAANSLLSLIVAMAGLSSLSYVSLQASVFVGFATLLSLYNLALVVQTALMESQEASEGVDLHLRLHGHGYTSPDLPVVETEPDIPQRFIDGCEGNRKEAQRRWDITRHWRETEHINTILEEQQPHFETIKKMYPHYHAGRGKSGHVVFYERPGDLQMTQFTSRGIKTEHLIRHWLFVTEFQWQVLCEGDETAKGICVIDLNGIKMSDFAGDTLSFIKKTLSLAGQHYPERSHAIFILNVPAFFSMIWSVVKGFVHPNTQKKINILSRSEVLKGLQTHIDISQIPVYYGGEMRFGEGEERDDIDCCRFHSPDVQAITEHVKKLNEKANALSAGGLPSTSKLHSSFDNDLIDDSKFDDNWSVTSGTTAHTVNNR